MQINDTSSLALDELWDYNQPAATEARFRELLPQIGDQPALHAELLTQIARAQGLQRHFDAAHTTLDRVQAALTDTSADAMRRVRIRYLLERGRVFNSAGKAAAAQPLFHAAWELAQGAGEDFYAIDAAHMLGIVAVPAEQLQWNLLALTLTVQTIDPRAKRWLASLSNNIGWSYFAQGDYATALEYFSQACEARQSQGDVAALRIARWSVAKTLRMLGQVEAALSIQTDLLAELQAIGEVDGYVYEELGEGYWQQGQPQQAAPFFALAHHTLAQDEWFVANEEKRLDRLKMLRQRPE